MIEILPENPAQHACAIEDLFDATFGPGHFAKTAERVREFSVSLPHLNHVALMGDEVVGVCRIWPLQVGKEAVPAIFAGPVAVHPKARGQFLGQRITQASMDAAKAAEWPLALLIGDVDYFSGVGFIPAAAGRFIFPGPQDSARIMYHAFSERGETASGFVQARQAPTPS